MATRNGKIANLSNDIREQLNLRLLEGENGRELAAWLNALPAVRAVLSSQFNGSPISEVNLTHWRQGGYLQWLTERECFDSARALADSDCNLAQTGLSAERLLNILTLRFGELLMRWDLPLDEGASAAVAFSLAAKKARILQGISRSVLAIHRIQSQRSNSSPVSKPPLPLHHPSPRKTAPPPARTACLMHPQISSPVIPAPRSLVQFRPGLANAISNRLRPDRGGSNPSHTPFKPDLDLSEILQAV